MTARCSYLEMDRHLRRVGALLGPAEAHGLAYGLTAVADEVSIERWQEEVFAECDLSNELAQGSKQLVAPLYLEAAHNRKFGSLPELFLPSDDQDIRDRALGLRDWCRGFLYGLGLSEGFNLAALSTEANEALGDIGEFASLSAPEQSGEDTDEAAIVELQEYLKVAVTVIRDEILTK